GVAEFLRWRAWGIAELAFWEGCGAGHLRGGRRRGRGGRYRPCCVPGVCGGVRVRCPAGRLRRYLMDVPRRSLLLRGSHCVASDFLTAKNRLKAGLQTVAELRTSAGRRCYVTALP